MGKMRHLDLFSGIGGFSLGLEAVGFQTIGFCEKDEFCRKVLAKHWPDVPCFSDIKDLKYSTATGLLWDGRQDIDGYPIDIITGGFPCQPFSQAGKRQGVADDRYLWPEMLRVIREVRPRWVLGENVAGIVKMALDQVLADLEGLGYTCQSFIVPACAVDAPHQRKRVWIVAHHSEHGRGSWRQGRSDPSSEREPEQALSDVANPTQQYVDRAGAARPRGWNEHPNSGWWLPEPRICRVAHGVQDRVHRLRSLGNAVVPELVERFGQAIMVADYG